MNKKLPVPLLIMGGMLSLLLIGMTIGIVTRKAPEEIIEEPVEEPKEPEPDFSKIEVISGKYFYEDENFSSRFGIDVSTFQEDIDWKKVKDEGVEFAYIRIGRRGGTTGLLYPDDKFEKNYDGAVNNGIEVGIYFFSQAINEMEAIEEADFMLKLLGNRKLDLPIVYDLEEVLFDDEKARTEDLDKKTNTDNALAFLKRIKEKGYDGVVYTNLYWAENRYEMDRLSDYPIWFAQYDREKQHPELELPIFIWQYSNSGTISGIKEPTDLNIMFIRKENKDE
ncbi:MAG: glycoside hydrolase family 25 protein [Erysipelotrichaceae bacterium]|nr:glycoside hydrolase family 25 protein [Erysipelotrichaceae bacterium]